MQSAQHTAKTGSPPAAAPPPSLRLEPRAAYDMAALRAALHALADRITEEGAHELNGTAILDLLVAKLQRRVFGDDGVHFICDVCECEETHTVDCPLEIVQRWADGRVA